MASLKPHVLCNNRILCVDLIIRWLRNVWADVHVDVHRVGLQAIDKFLGNLLDAVNARVVPTRMVRVLVYHLGGVRLAIKYVLAVTLGGDHGKLCDAKDFEFVTPTLAQKISRVRNVWHQVLVAADVAIRVVHGISVIRQRGPHALELTVVAPRIADILDLHHLVLGLGRQEVEQRLVEQHSCAELKGRIVQHRHWVVGVRYLVAAAVLKVGR
mmetsp:Transcript_44227/g.105871  ORF Transcript_44227/g.105871 Transcript_44227/m.105871 type:complete len:213 (-) Transcript_44227:1015-1653(-)